MRKLPTRQVHLDFHTSPDIPGIGAKFDKAQFQAALKEGNFEKFLRLIKQSGYSSYMYLQNVIPAGYKAHQDVAVALALAEHYLNGRGAYRVHGGGFAGTIQAFVPFDILDSFVAGMDAVLGAGACHVLSIRPQGGVEMEVK